MEPELEGLLARAKIDDLLGLYGFYADGGAIDEWLDLFCDDAWMDVPDYRGVSPTATVRLSGKQEIRASIVEAPAVVAVRGRMQHHMSGSRTISVDGHDAVVNSYCIVFIAGETPSGGGAVNVTPSLSFNRWTLRREGGNWRIASCIRRRVDQSTSILQDVARSAALTREDNRPRIQRINHTAISVSDLTTSISFYTEQLGLELVATQPAIESIPGMATVVGVDADQLRGSWALLSAGDDRVELVEYSSPAGRAPEGRRHPSDLGLAHLALQVDDADAIHQRLVDSGVMTVSPPVSLGRHRSFYAYGPDGELIELLTEEPAVTPPT